MKKCFLIPVALISILFSFSCKKSSSSTDIISSVTVVYSCSPKLSHILSIVENGQFMVGIGYAPDPNYLGARIISTNVDFTFKFGDTLFAEMKETVAPNKHYSVFFGGQSSNPCKIFMEDELPIPDSDMAEIRFINMSSDSYTYNCYVNGVKINSGLSYQNISSYYKVSAKGLLSIRFSDAINSTIGAVVDSQIVGPGGIYSFIISGNYGSTTSGLHIEKIYQNPVLIL